MDFRLTEDQIMLRRMVREFAQNELKPKSLELDAKPEPADCFSWELVDKASELGLRLAALPVEIGGEGITDLLTQVILFEELAAGDLGFATMFGNHNIFLWQLNEFCSEEQKKEFIPKIIKDNRFFVALGMTEPESGTDNTIPYDAPGAAVKTFAERKGDEYIINGTKHFISNGSIAKLYLIYARTNKELPLSQSLSLFLVPADTPGFSIASLHNKLGRRLLMNAELTFEDARVPARYLVGEESKAYYTVYRTERSKAEVLIMAAAILGGLRAIYETALDYARTRVQTGKPIIQHPTIGIQLAEMRAKIEAGRALLWKNAWSFDNQYEYDWKLCFLNKAFIGESAISILDHAMDIFGGMGPMKGLYMEKYLRDMYTSLHGYGNTRMNLLAGMPTV